MSHADCLATGHIRKKKAQLERMGERLAVLEMKPGLMQGAEATSEGIKVQFVGLDGAPSESP